MAEPGERCIHDFHPDACLTCKDQADGGKEKKQVSEWDRYLEMVREEYERYVAPPPRLA